MVQVRDSNSFDSNINQPIAHDTTHNDNYWQHIQVDLSHDPSISLLSMRYFDDFEPIDYQAALCASNKVKKFLFNNLKAKEGSIKSLNDEKLQYQEACLEMRVQINQSQDYLKQIKEKYSQSKYGYLEECINKLKDENSHYALQISFLNRTIENLKKDIQEITSSFDKENEQMANSIIRLKSERKILIKEIKIQKKALESTKEELIRSNIRYSQVKSLYRDHIFTDPKHKQQSYIDDSNSKSKTALEKTSTWGNPTYKQISSYPPISSDTGIINIDEYTSIIKSQAKLLMNNFAPKIAAKDLTSPDDKKNITEQNNYYCSNSPRQVYLNKNMQHEVNYSSTSVKTSLEQDNTPIMSSNESISSHPVYLQYHKSTVQEITENFTLTNNDKPQNLHNEYNKTLESYETSLSNKDYYQNKQVSTMNIYELSKTESNYNLCSTTSNKEMLQTQRSCRNYTSACFDTNNFLSTSTPDFTNNTEYNLSSGKNINYNSSSNSFVRYDQIDSLKGKHIESQLGHLNSLNYDNNKSINILSEMPSEVQLTPSPDGLRDETEHFITKKEPKQVQYNGTLTACEGLDKQSFNEQFWGSYEESVKVIEQIETDEFVTSFQSSVLTNIDSDNNAYKLSEQLKPNPKLIDSNSSHHLFTFNKKDILLDHPESLPSFTRSGSNNTQENILDTVEDLHMYKQTHSIGITQVEELDVSITQENTPITVLDNTLTAQAEFVSHTQKSNHEEKVVTFSAHSNDNIPSYPNDSVPILKDYPIPLIEPEKISFDPSQEELRIIEISTHSEHILYEPSPSESDELIEHTLDTDLNLQEDYLSKALSPDKNRGALLQQDHSELDTLNISRDSQVCSNITAKLPAQPSQIDFDDLYNQPNAISSPTTFGIESESTVTTAFKHSTDQLTRTLTKSNSLTRDEQIPREEIPHSKIPNPPNTLAGTPQDTFLNQYIDTTTPIVPQNDLHISDANIQAGEINETELGTSHHNSFDTEAYFDLSNSLPDQNSLDNQNTLGHKIATDTHTPDTSQLHKQAEIKDPISSKTDLAKAYDSSLAQNKAHTHQVAFHEPQYTHKFLTNNLGSVNPHASRIPTDEKILSSVSGFVGKAWSSAQDGIYKKKQAFLDLYPERSNFMSATFNHFLSQPETKEIQDTSNRFAHKNLQDANTTSTKPSSTHNKNIYLTNIMKDASDIRNINFGELFKKL